MAKKEYKSYIEGKCTCGTPYKVYVNSVPGVFKMITLDACVPHTKVFFCPGCDRKKTVQYFDSDVMQEEIPADDSGQERE